MTEVAAPGDILGAMRFGNPQTQARPITSSQHAFTVDGTPAIGVVDTSSSLVVPGNDPSTAKTTVAVCDFYDGTGLPNGTGTDGGCQPVGDGSAHSKAPVFVIPDWPTQGRQVYGWTHLPAHTAYVAYAYQNQDRGWVTPIDGVALLSVPRPAVFDGNYQQWSSAPFALLRALNVDGQVIAKTYAPRISGDNVPPVP